MLHRSFWIKHAENAYFLVYPVFANVHVKNAENHR